MVFRGAETLHNQFLYYFLSRETFMEEGAKRMAGAVGHKRVTKEFIENTLIPLPPLPEQQCIVAILDAAFEGITTATANAKKICFPCKTANFSVTPAHKPCSIA
ncbi:MAG: restriction endonuclease subunit S [Gammaproteobacteria bacterium]